MSSSVGADKLPFRGQFPLARVNGEQFRDLIGLPPHAIPAAKRDYGMFLLLNTLSSEFNCPSCK